jgi:hypothetical protein
VGRLGSNASAIDPTELVIEANKGGVLSVASSPRVLRRGIRLVKEDSGRDNPLP